MTRVRALLSRMKENRDVPKVLRQCCEALTIGSRSDHKKLMIAREGLSEILLAVQTYLLTDVALLTSACDLLWTLAFNDSRVKERIRVEGGIEVVIQILRHHPEEQPLIKSALGSLSNLCQLPDNQLLIGQSSGIDHVLVILQSTHASEEIIQLALDTLASVIVAHEPNCKIFHAQHGIATVVQILQQVHLIHVNT